jgi:fumarate hydratase subunit alpha
VIHTEIVPGDRLRIQVMPKGFGCENMSRFAMLLPGAGREGITEFVLRTVDESGGNPCPPVIVGLGIGGSADYSMWLAKKALTRRVGASIRTRRPPPSGGSAGEGQRPRPRPQAVGGAMTALAVHIEFSSTSPRSRWQ